MPADLDRRRSLYTIETGGTRPEQGRGNNEMGLEAYCEKNALRCDLHDVASVDGEGPALAAHQTLLLTRDVAVERQFAVHEGHAVKIFQELEAGTHKFSEKMPHCWHVPAVAVVRAASWVRTSDEQPLPRNLRSQVWNEFLFNAITAE